MRLAEHVACMGDMKGAYMVLVGKLEGKRPLGRPRHIWEDNIKNGSLRCWRCGDVDWIDLPKDRHKLWALVNMVINLWVP